MTVVDGLGLAAGFCTTAAFAPQALLILKTRKVEGISLGMYSTFTAGVALWVLYGLAIGSVAIVLSNVITLLLAGTVLVLKVRLAAGTITDLDRGMEGRP